MAHLGTEKPELKDTARLIQRVSYTISPCGKDATHHPIVCGELRRGHFAVVLWQPAAVVASSGAQNCVIQAGSKNQNRQRPYA